ncbi:Mct1 [Bugula neritina]|uniref:Mct1 n=1 Tax=Bugula neritina TaxID=10212 RepID=A0A7J7KMS8_BUGNE|nr:Mct1 [Bugula neritina]
MNCCPRISTNKDRGYAWWILFMSFLSHVCNRGFSYGILGNMTIAHQKFFNIGLQESGIIGSLHVATIFLFAPLASIMVKKLGCRTVEILGGCCLILGFGLSSLSTQSWHAFILFSLLAGNDTL